MFREPQRQFDQDFYDFLDALVERVPWRGEEEPKKWRELVQKLREVNVFGYMSTQLTVPEVRKI